MPGIAARLAGLLGAGLVALAAACAPFGGPAQAQDKVSFAVRERAHDLTLGAWLWRPNTEAPRPAVILLHGCSGLTGTMRTWGRVLSEWGYVALAIDSFEGRGVKEVCTRDPARAREVSPRDRVFDVAGAAAFLRERPFVRGDRLVLMGASHGGAATLFAALRLPNDRGAPLPTPAFAGAIALYPDCSLRGSEPATAEALRPLLILIGAADDWTPASRCEGLVPRIGGQPVALKVYPDAHHAYDSVGTRVRFRPDVANRNKPGGCCGATLGYDEPAYKDTLKQVDAFLRARVGGPQ